MINRDSALGIANHKSPIHPQLYATAGPTNSAIAQNQCALIASPDGIDVNVLFANKKLMLFDPQFFPAYTSVANIVNMKSDDPIITSILKYL
jgi:hypothetical protein